MKICIAGKNDIAVNALDYLLHVKQYPKEDIVVIINKTDTGSDTWQKSLKKYAIDNNIPIVLLEQVYNIENLLFISLEFDKIIKTKNFKTNKIFNIHFSNLPKYKGMYTSILPILKGEKEAGVTLHRIDDGIDTGEIIDQITFNIKLEDTSRDLYFKYLTYGFELFKKNIDNILLNNVTSNKQSVIGSSYYSKQYINFEKIEINFNKTSYEIYNQIRAFIFPEYQLPTINNQKIMEVKLTNDFIGYNCFFEQANDFILSGIDGYKIVATKNK